MSIHKLLKTIEYTLLTLTIACFCYIVYFFLIQKSVSYRSYPLSSSETSETASRLDYLSQELKPFYYYARDIETRNIFANPPKAKTAEETGIIGKLPSHMKVVGIVFADPTQIIIEDTKKNETYFIEEGSPAGGIRIKQAYKDKIILQYQNQNIEINLRGNQVNAPNI